MRLLIIAFFVFLSTVCQAQQVFISAGKIEFEKQVNLHKEIDESWGDDDDDIWKQNYKKNLPKIGVSYFDLYFNENKSIYKAGKEAQQGLLKVPEWMADKALDNIIYNDVQQQQTTSQKNIFENTFLIQDSIRKIDWRITNDTRTIAGVECRKAIGKIMDSVYVIAFYTDIITSSCGPESFTCLPGLILGVAIPRINTTWFATKIELITVPDAMLIAPKKGKKASYQDLMIQLRKSTKDWGKNGDRNIWKLMI